jgi:hypothetical protein
VAQSRACGAVPEPRVQAQTRACRACAGAVVRRTR